MAKPRLTFRLRFPEADIEKWAKEYEYGDDDEVLNVIAPAAKAQGYLTRDQFLHICKWKTQRSKKRCEENKEDTVREATQLAFSAKHDAIKIGILRALSGVEWATASVILHFCDAHLYPIIDFRALWSLGFDKQPTYTNRFWQEYTEYVRKLSSSTGHSMRTLDRAFWQYSKKKQKQKAD